MRYIDEQSNSRADEGGQPGDGLTQDNPSRSDEVIRRGQEAMERQRRGFDDWMLIAEALQVGRANIMRAIHTNQPTGKRYEKAIAEWLFAHSFHLIDKGARNRALECLKHRAEIEKWRATLTEAERFCLNHPNAVLRKWQAATVVPDPNTPAKISAIAKLRDCNVELQEKLYRAERELSLGGGDLWSPEDTAEDIATVMLAKLPPPKAERVARAILKRLTGKNAASKAATVTELGGVA